MVGILPGLQRGQVALGVLDASLLPDCLYGVGAALDGALLESLGAGRVLALSKRPGPHLSVGVTDGEVPLVLGRVMFLAGVGNGAGDEGQAGELGECNHCVLWGWELGSVSSREKECMWNEREESSESDGCFPGRVPRECGCW